MKEFLPFRPAYAYSYEGLDFALFICLALATQTGTIHNLPDLPSMGVIELSKTSENALGVEQTESITHSL